MKKTILICMLMCMLSSPVFSAEKCETITVADSVTTLTQSFITSASMGDAKFGTCRLETAQIRVWLDGTDPSTSLGMVLNAGDVVTFNTYDDLKKFKAIRTGSTSGVLSWCYR